MGHIRQKVIILHQLHHKFRDKILPNRSQLKIDLSSIGHWNAQNTCKMIPEQNRLLADDFLLDKTSSDNVKFPRILQNTPIKLRKDFADAGQRQSGCVYALFDLRDQHMEVVHAGYLGVQLFYKRPQRLLEI